MKKLKKTLNDLMEVSFLITMTLFTIVFSIGLVYLPIWFFTH